MKKTLLILGCVFLILYCPTAFAQVQAYSFNASSTTFTPLTSGTNVSSIEADDAYDTVSIGFNFALEGTSASSIIVSSNGWISLANPTNSTLSNNLSGASSSLRPLIAPLWDDLDGSSGTASYEVTGTAPNRVFTFEWLHWEWNYSSNDSIASFQVKLYETTNEIQFIYHTENFSSINYPSASIGLAGMGSGSGTYLSVHDIGTGAPYATDTLEDSQIDTLVDNQVFTFTPPACSVPALSSLTNLKYDSVTVNFTASGSGPWYINYGPDGFTQGDPSSNFDTTTTSSFIIGGLTAEQDYDFYLKSDCGSNGQSIWFGPYSFTTPPSCPAPSNVTDSNVTTGSLDLGWQSNGGGPWYIYWGPVGFDQATPTAQLDTSGTNNMTFTGLASGTGYDFYIIEDCGGLGQSDTVGPFTYYTQCFLTAPLVYDFENGFNAGDYGPNINTCLHSIKSSIPRWEVEDATGSNENSSGTGPYWDNTLFGTSGGHYLYLETSGGSLGDADTLYTSPIDVSALTNPYLSFAYHMYGADMGTLKVEYYNGSTWDSLVSFTGQQQTAGSDPWVIYGDTLSGLSSDTIEVRFIGIRGNNYTSDMSIDDFEVIEAPSCAGSTLLTLDQDSLTSSSAFVSWTPGYGSKFQVLWGPSGFTPPLGATGTATVTDTFYSINGLSAQTTYDVYVRDSCSAGYSSFSSATTFTTKCLATSMPYYESFDNWPLSCWDSIGGTEYWFKYDPGTGDNYARGNFWSWTSGNYSVLTSPTVSITQDAMVRFKWSHEYMSSYPDDELILRASIAGSGVWDTIADLKGPNDFNDPGAGSTSPGSFTEEKDILDPSKYTGQDVNLQLIAFSGWGPDVFVNDFYVENAPSCVPPYNLTTSGISDSSATLGWSGNAGSYQVWFGPQGFYQGTATVGGTKTIVSTNSISIDTLSGNTCYEFVVRAICSPGDTSDWDWEGALHFCTPCTPFMAPYIENFDLLSTGLAGDFGNCWIGTGTTSDYSWRSNSGSTPSSPTGPNGDATSGTGVYLYTEASSGSSGDSAMVVSPLVNISGLTSPELRFAFHMFGSNIDTLYVDVYDGVTWSNDALQINGQQQTASSDPWRDTSLALSPYINSNYVQVRFRLTSEGCCTGDAAIDDIYIDNPITCFAPTNLGDSAITDTSAILTYSSNGSGTFQISYGPSIQTPQAGTMVTTTGNSYYALNGLSASTEYCYYIREICSVGDTSYWTGPYCFNTLCGPINLPYLEQFTGPDLPNCYTTSNQSGSTSGNAFWKYAGTWPAYGAGGVNNAPGSMGGSVGVDGSSSNDSAVILETPEFNMATAFSPYLRFKKFQNNTNTSTNPANQTLFVDFFDGTTWHNGIVVDSANSPTWVTHTIDLSGYTITDPVMFHFRVNKYTGDPSPFYSDILIDDFEVFDSASCPVPTNIAITPVACDSIMVNWSSSEDSTYLAVAPSGSMPTSAMLVQNDTMAYIGGTTANTNYDLYMASICGGDTSALIGPVSFNSGNAGAPTAMFNYSVNNYDVSFDASGSMGNGNSYSWDFGDGSSGVGDTISHTYASGGSQQVTLTVTNACGSADTTFTIAGISIEEITLGAQVSIFPNPSNDVTNVNVDLDQKGNITIELHSLNGKLISTHTYSSAYEVKEKLDLSRLPDGVYLIRIKTDNGDIIRKLIKG